uniref:Uncharacterized protein n=1 Tax=Anguilla anguilla TaxID=7936 RepID=A0A0E9PYF5_ANGAN
MNLNTFFTGGREKRN